MKKYWKQIVGGIILVLVLILIGKETHKGPAVNQGDMNTIENQNVVHGEVTAKWEGNHTLKYNFKLLDGATTSLSMDNRLVTVKNASSSPMHFYFSYEGGRGYSADDYIKNNIANRVAVVKRETVAHGANNWSVVHGVNSSWHVGAYGEWLVVVENLNADQETANKYIDSFQVENLDSSVSVEEGVKMDATLSSTTHEMN